jgi:hypothetical protein
MSNYNENVNDVVKKGKHCNLNWNLFWPKGEIQTRELSLPFILQLIWPSGSNWKKYILFRQNHCCLEAIWSKNYINSLNCQDQKAYLWPKRSQKHSPKFGQLKKGSCDIAGMSEIRDRAKTALAKSRTFRDTGFQVSRKKFCLVPFKLPVSSGQERSWTELQRYFFKPFNSPVEERTKKMTVKEQTCSVPLPSNHFLTNLPFNPQSCERKSMLLVERR